MAANNHETTQNARDFQGTDPVTTAADLRNSRPVSRCSAVLADIEKEQGLIPLADAAARLGIEPKRLLGYLIRNAIGDPIGGDTPDGIMVYAWSIEPTRQRLANDSNPVQP